MARLLLLFIVAFHFATAPAQAAEINADGAARLKTLFIGLIADRKADLAQRGLTLRTQGDITVEQASGYYAVTLPEMSVVDKEGDMVDIGLIAVNAIPTENPDNWTMSVALPMPIIKRDESGREIGRLQVGRQQMNGFWDGTVKNFTKLGLLYNDIRYTDTRDNKVAALGRAEVTSDLTVKNGRLSGPTKINLAGLSSGTPANPGRNRAGSIIVEMNYEDISLDALLNPNMELSPSDYGGLIVKAAVNDIVADVELGSAAFEYVASKPENALANQTLTLNYRGLNVSEDNNEYAELIPAFIDINLDLNKLPIKDIFALIKTNMGGNGGTGAAAAAKKLAAFQALTILPAKMAQAGTVLEIDALNFNNDVYDVDTSGALAASSASPMGFVGGLSLKVKGLDETEDILQEKIKITPAPQKAILEKILQQVNLIQVVGKRVDDSYICDLNITENGEVTINGNPVGNALNMMGSQSGSR
jgi:hypothetical protein